ncbi:hypothetical protein RJ639_037687 [Escallonia herrerae]|uniref:C2 NT-type domain-containing protein n=1 Tax=Escallonia herrerae TaxID=1293975 RepID=A0AA89B743_9ASTE|nr:hypothetical protein RJ639_037687 [Escallonia herrerae]
MSRITKWKPEKAKVKVVFRLQFHATHIPQTGWEKLFITFIPTESGKPTAKTTKANVRNGTCKWGDPIYETTRLLQDSKSKQYDEKFYKLVVSMGSSRSSILGEATINLADYADASRPSAVALSLQGCNSGTILHVTVQLLTSKTGFREFEQQRELRERGLQMGTDLNRHDAYSTMKVTSSEETANDQVDKDFYLFKFTSKNFCWERLSLVIYNTFISVFIEVNRRPRSRPESKELPSLEEAGLNEEYANSAVGFDGSSNTSGSLYAEKHDASSTHEIDSLKSTVSGDLNGLTLCQSPRAEKGDPSDHRGWSSDYSMDNDLAIAYEENSRLRGTLEVAESSIFELKLEVSSLQSHADEIGTETQKFAYQLAAEIASGEELVKEVLVLKSECSKFKDDVESLKNLRLRSQFTSKESSQTEQNYLVQDIQLRWLKGIINIEDRIKELQNKTYLGFHERDYMFLHTDLEVLLGILQDLKQGTGQELLLLNTKPSERANVKESRDTNLHESLQYTSITGLDLDLYQPEDMLQRLSLPNLVSQEPERGAIDALKEENFDLLRQLNDAKIERESLSRKMDQMECYYEALIQELEESQKHMLGELQTVRNEHSVCMYTISTSKAEVESLSQNLAEQNLRFAAERRDLDSVCQELERRAITSEAALKRARLNYSIAVNQLQKDLELLSFQVLSMYKTNENLVKQALSETLQPCFQGYIDIVQNTEQSDANKLTQSQVQYAVANKQVSVGDILVEDLKKSLCSQEDLYLKIQEQLEETHSANLYLDVFSKTLQETLLEAHSHSKQMKMKMDEFAQQLELSTDSRDILMVKLQAAMDDVHSLNDQKANCIAKCSDMLLQNQNLETKLEILSKENCLLMLSITECKELVTKYRGYESKYESCLAEKLELESLLTMETLESGNLQKEVSSLKEELKILKAGLDSSSLSEENLQKTINFMRDKLGRLLMSSNKQITGLNPWIDSQCKNMDLEDVNGMIVQLEETQNSTCVKILELMEENKDLEYQRDTAEVSLSTAKLEILELKQKFKHDIQNMVAKLNISNALVQKLQLGLDSVANKFHISMAIEDKHAQQNEELLAYLDPLEVELQKLTCKSRDLAQEISGLNVIAEELGRSRMSIGELIQDKQDLVVSLQDKNEESVKLAIELGSLKDSLRCLHDELHVERGFRGKLEGMITDLSSQLEIEHDKLLQFDRQNAELVHFRQLASNLELERSRSTDLLLWQELLEKHRKASSYSNDLMSQLQEMHEHILAADVGLTYVITQYETRVEELVQQLQFSDGHHRELQRNHLDAKAVLNRCLANEAHYTEENAKLLTDLESLGSQLKASFAQNEVLSDSNNVIMAQLEEYRKRFETLEISLSEDKNQYAFEVEQRNHMLLNAEEEISNLVLSKEELEMIVILLKAKLDEQNAHIAHLEEQNNELMMLRSRCNEITRKLSEQIMKTEEFKNLSIHLKELKDKADAGCNVAREKKEPDGPSGAMQESLRIAFIKEQYETRLQELRQQLSISRRHGEEMLIKLQDTVDETENMKKSEASNLKKNEELSTKILELEAELQSVLFEKRERTSAYDRIMAELECALLSLDCCKEEKEKLEASFQECKEEKLKFAVEFSLIKQQLEHSTPPPESRSDENGKLEKVRHISDDLFVGKVYEESPMAGTSKLERKTMDFSESFSIKNSVPENVDKNSLWDSEEVQDASSSDAGGNLTVPMNPHTVQGIPEQALLDQGDFLPSNAKRLAAINNHFRTQSLKSSMEHLHEELERMKNENTVLPQINFDPKFQDLRTELLQLQKANQELGSIFPLFNEFPDSGNALERVLALEVELAESLRAKKKSSIHFQSSFLKQHGDEEAVFKSFRDINELIKDMLELKGRYGAVETELKEMHDRYSQLSLQFAEVEGERQKLMMTLKNVRTSKKLVHLSRSSSDTLPH